MKIFAFFFFSALFLISMPAIACVCENTPPEEEISNALFSGVIQIVDAEYGVSGNKDGPMEGKNLPVPTGDMMYKIKILQTYSGSIDSDVTVLNPRPACAGLSDPKKGAVYRRIITKSGENFVFRSHCTYVTDDLWNQFELKTVPTDDYLKIKNECTAKGGNWRFVKSDGYCYLPSLNAGEKCQDNRECDGYCQADAESTAALISSEDYRLMRERKLKASGVCSEWTNNPFADFSVVREYLTERNAR